MWLWLRGSQAVTKASAGGEQSSLGSAQENFLPSPLTGLWEGLRRSPSKLTCVDFSTGMPHALKLASPLRSPAHTQAGGPAYQEVGHCWAI